MKVKTLDEFENRLKAVHTQILEGTVLYSAKDALGLLGVVPTNVGKTVNEFITPENYFMLGDTRNKTGPDSYFITRKGINQYLIRSRSSIGLEFRQLLID